MDVNCDGQVNVITFGDSITYGIGDELQLGGYSGRLGQLFPEAIIHNFGKPGESTIRGVSRAPEVFQAVANADFIIILEGVNDYFEIGHDQYVTRSRLLSMVSSANSTGALTTLMNLTDVRRSFQKPWVRSVNVAIARNKNIDLFSLGDNIISEDLLHPNAAGYDSIVNLVAPYLLAISLQHRPPDSDGDGIYDWAEAKYGANPAVRDTDGDGLIDGDEVFVYGSSPALLDSDGDGLTDPYEVNLGSNPGDPRPGPPTITSSQIVLP